jgi:hypothetical protein
VSELIKTHLGKKELDRQAISKIANLITALIKEDREQQKQSAKKQNCTAVQNHKTTNQSNDLSNEYENTNK